MSFLSSLNITASGMTVQRLRLDVAAENIANIETTRTESGGPYRRKMVVVEAKDNSFNSMFKKSLDRFDNNASKGGLELDQLLMITRN